MNGRCAFGKWRLRCLLALKQRFVRKKRPARIMPFVAPELSFDRRLQEAGISLERTLPRSLQLNLGKRCNLTCAHCHVNAGPNRKEAMTSETIERVLEWGQSHPSIEVFDFTGGAPEMHNRFRFAISTLRAARPDATIIDRCNLTILLEPGYEDLGAFLAEQRAQIVASMPCYQPDNVNAQRGEGVFDASIEALVGLNRLGYGRDPDLALHLVYNPVGPSLPPDQSELEADYKRALKEGFGIEFDSLFTIANMPIARFLGQLRRDGMEKQYRQLLVESFNPASVSGLMCRDTISVDWQGRVFDCDFNQMLELPMGGRETRFLWEIDSSLLDRLPIATGSHCFGCAAGAGSSCSGALDAR